MSDKTKDNIHPDRKQENPRMGGLGETHGSGAAFPILAAPVTGQTGARGNNTDQDKVKTIRLYKLRTLFTNVGKDNFKDMKVIGLPNLRSKNKTRPKNAEALVDLKDLILKIKLYKNMTKNCKVKTYSDLKQKMETFEMQTIDMIQILFRV